MLYLSERVESHWSELDCMYPSSVSVEDNGVSVSLAIFFLKKLCHSYF